MAPGKKSSNILWVQGTQEGGKVCIYERDPNHPAYPERGLPAGEVYIAGRGGPIPVYRTAMVMERMRDGLLEQVDPPEEAATPVLPPPVEEVPNDGDPSPAPPSAPPSAPAEPTSEPPKSGASGGKKAGG